MPVYLTVLHSFTPLSACELSVSHKMFHKLEKLCGERGGSNKMTHAEKREANRLQTLTWRNRTGDTGTNRITFCSYSMKL